MAGEVGGCVGNVGENGGKSAVGGNGGKWGGIGKSWAEWVTYGSTVQHSIHTAKQLFPYFAAYCGLFVAAFPPLTWLAKVRCRGRERGDTRVPAMLPP